MVSRKGKKQTKKEAKKGNPNLRRFTRGMVSGNLLRMPEVQRQLKYVAIIALFMLLYITNGYYTQKLNRKYTRLNNEVKELRTKSLSPDRDANDGDTPK